MRYTPDVTLFVDYDPASESTLLTSSVRSMPVRYHPASRSGRSGVVTGHLPDDRRKREDRRRHGRLTTQDTALRTLFTAGEAGGARIAAAF